MWENQERIGTTLVYPRLCSLVFGLLTRIFWQPSPTNNIANVVKPTQTKDNSERSPEKDPARLGTKAGQEKIGLGEPLETKDNLGKVSNS